MFDVPICCSLVWTFYKVVSGCHDRQMYLDLRADISPSKRRGIFDIIVTRHMLAHDGDLVSLVLGEKIGRCQSGNTSSSQCQSFVAKSLDYRTHPTTTIVLAMLIDVTLYESLTVYGS